MELESAVERLYSDESLAADVDDATAKPLLKWAEQQLPGMIERFGDGGFDDAFVTLKKLVKSIARIIDMRTDIDNAERAERAEKIQTFAQELGIAVNTDSLSELMTASGPAMVSQMLGAPASAASDPPESAVTPAGGVPADPLAAVPASATPGTQETPASQAAPAESGESSPVASATSAIQAMMKQIAEKIASTAQPSKSETPDTEE